MCFDFLRKNQVQQFCPECPKLQGIIDQKETQLFQMKSNYDLARATISDQTDWIQELTDSITVLNDEMWSMGALLTLRDSRIKELEEGSQEEYPYRDSIKYKVVNGDVIERTMDKVGVKLHRSPLDTEYRVSTLVDIATWIDHNRTNVLRYLTNYRDCDTFAAKVWGDYRWDTLCNNIVLIIDYSGGHAYVGFFVWNEETDDIELWILEPQNDVLWQYEDKDGMYDMEFGLFLI